MLDGLDAPQRAARSVLADVMDGKAEDQLLDAMPVASELINSIQHSTGAVLSRSQFDRPDAIHCGRTCD
ncbi:hypothetical protein AB0O75_45140 [Streptomyces sp. NPDC088921]|uniref:hypothetical protein n=1 Tax=unclassified Streptomyces TaxID=2593676 RepID=UPI00343BCA30